LSEPLARLDGVAAGYGDTLVFRDLDLSLPHGRVIALCGPNGSGKSSALRLMRGLLGLAGGTAEIAGRPIGQWSARGLARAVAMLPQSPEAPGEMTVADLVRLGRFAHRRPFAGLAAADHAACRAALAATDMTGHADAPIGALSGGQLQRAWIAMVLAQDAPAILLDEPTNHLDIAHALEVLDLVRRLNREEGRSVVLVLHDLNLAARYADHVVLFAQGGVAAQGARDAVLTEALIARVFGVRCRVLHDPAFGFPVIVPIDRTEADARPAD